MASSMGPGFIPGNIFKKCFLKHLPKAGSMTSRVRAAFEGALSELVDSGLVEVDEDGHVYFTTKGERAEKSLSLSSAQRAAYAANIRMAAMENVFRKAAMPEARDNANGYPLSADERKRKMKTVDATDPTRTLIEENVVMYRPKIRMGKGPNAPTYRPRLYLKIDPTKTTVVEAQKMREKVHQRAKAGNVFDAGSRRTVPLGGDQGDADAPFHYPVYLPPNAALLEGQPATIREVVPRGRYDRHLGPRGQASFVAEPPRNFRLSSSQDSGVIVLDVVYTAYFVHNIRGRADVENYIQQALFPANPLGTARDEGAFRRELGAFVQAGEILMAIYNTPMSDRAFAAYARVMSDRFGIQDRSLKVFSEMDSLQLEEFHKFLNNIYQPLWNNLPARTRENLKGQFKSRLAPLRVDPRKSAAGVTTFEESAPDTGRAATPQRRPSRAKPPAAPVALQEESGAGDLPPEGGPGKTRRKIPGLD